MDGRSDKNLVAASRKGDRSAYAHLVEKYYRQVFLICVGILGNVHDAEDIAQESILKGFTEIKKLRDGCQFGNWLTRIAKNMCINLTRRQKSKRKAIRRKAMQQEQLSLEYRNLEEAIERLPKDVRLPLIMYYFDGQSVKNVADKLNISSAGVYVKLRTATKRLHELLVRQGDLDE